MPSTLLFIYSEEREKLAFFEKTIKGALKKNARILILFPTNARRERFSQKLKKPFSEEIGQHIILGLRSAILNPPDNLAAIIIDDEHHHGYYEQRHPRFDATKAAEIISQELGVQLIFSSPAPSLERYYKAEQGLYAFSQPSLPLKQEGTAITLIDIKNEAQTAISHSLKEKIALTLKEKQKVLLFLNRRGLATIVFCQDCKYTFLCHICETPLVYHHSKKQLLCHRCNAKEDVPLFCPKCKSPEIQFKGKGTEKVIEELRALFPEASSSRLDLESRSLPLSLPDIIVGTQLVFSNIPLPLITRVKLLGVISADTILNLPDFKNHERTFQMLTEIRLFAEANALPLIIQTSRPENYAITSAAKGEYQLFYRQELEQRQKFYYPPFCHLIKLSALFKAKDQGEKAVFSLFQGLDKMVKIWYNKKIQVLPPFCSDYKVKAKYQWSIMLKTSVLPSHKSVHALLKQVPLNWNIEVDAEGLS
jgi:primosomal protein N' (replication factor Y)